MDSGGRGGMQFTIKQLLIIWAGVGLAATLVLAAAGVVSTNRMATLQNHLVRTVLPAEAASRELSTLLVHYVARQEAINQSLTPDELQRLPARQELDRRFAETTARLSGVSQELVGVGEAVKRLGQSYQQFLASDGQLLELTQRRLDTLRQLKDKAAATDAVVEKLTTDADGIKGKVALDIARGKRQVRQAMSGKTAVPGELRRLVDATLLGSSFRIAQVTDKVLGGVAQMATLSRQIRLEASRDALTSLKSNQIKQMIDLTRQSMALLKSSANEAPAGVAELAASLEGNFAKLTALLVEADDSTFQLVWRILEVNKQLAEAHQTAEAAQKGVTEGLEGIAKLADQVRSRVSQEAAEVVSASQLLVYATALLVALFMVVFGAFVIRRITVPLDQAVAVVDRIAAGDLTVTIHPQRADEVGRLLGAMGNMVTALREIFQRLAHQAEQLTGSSQELATVSTLINDNTATMQRQTQAAVQSVENSSTNLTSISGAVEQASANLTSISGAAEQASANLGAVSAAAEQASVNLTAVVGSAEQANARMTEVRQRAEQTSGNVQTVAAAVQEMTASLGEIRKRCLLASQESAKADQQAKRAQEVMSRLTESGQDIHKVVGVINGIADQTNMLALNAAIEAAGAGEAGKGFAVVANEVKELARQTAEATRMIADKINGMMANSGEASTASHHILDIIQTISQANDEIVQAVEEQDLAAKEITRSMGEASTQTNAVTHVISQAAHDMENVTRAVSEVSLGIAEVTRNVTELSTGVEEMTRNVATASVGSRDITHNVSGAAAMAGEIAVTMDHLRAAVMGVAHISGTLQERSQGMAQMAHALEEIVDRFKRA